MTGCASPPPRFSIIVPTYGRPKQLAICLQALARLAYPRDRFEVIVVDDGSQSPPEEVVSAFHGQLDVTLLDQPHAGPAAARNTGAARAKGEFLAFTDDDCAPTPDWLSALAARFAAMPECMIGGRTLNALPENPYSAASQLLVDYLYAYYNANPERVGFFTSNNLALPRRLFWAIGGFDSTFPRAAAEDREFCDRWRYHGYRMIYAPEAVVYHAHALTFRTFWRQHVNYGRGACCFHRLRAQRGCDRIKLEPLSFYVQLLRYPSARGQCLRRRLRLTALLGISQLANAVGFFWESRRQ
ncbi:MAG: glycosyltransferase [Candidatus Binatia bacterium]|nr:glycosyltransferase [Candidatus Binatia bacterium]